MLKSKSPRSVNISRRNRAKRNARQRRLEALEPRQMLERTDWQNPLLAYDVSGDDISAQVTPLDAILVINALSGHLANEPTQDLPNRDAEAPFYDVSGDNRLSPIDAVRVINYLNAHKTVPTDTISPLEFTSLSVDTTTADDNSDVSPSVIPGSATESRVNTTTVEIQETPAVAVSDQGTVVVWASNRQDGSDWGVFGQRFGLDGAKIGQEFSVNVTKRSPQRAPRVAAWADGRFVVTWEGAEQAGDDSWGIYARLFKADGTPATGELHVNQSVQGTQRYPSVAVLTDGTFAIGWEGKGTAKGGKPENYEVFVRRFNADGLPLSNEFRVNTTTDGNQELAAIAPLPTGGFAIAWSGAGPSDREGIYLRRFGSDGTPQSADILVNKFFQRGNQRRAALAVSPSGQILVAWQSTEHQWGSGVYAQRIGADGNLVGPEILVNQTLKDNQWHPSVAAMADGSFVVAWEGKGDQDNYGIFTRRFGADGAPLTDERLMNRFRRGLQRDPVVTATANSFVIAWDGLGPGDCSGIFTQGLERSVTVINQAPVNTVPGTQVVLEDQTLVFAAASENAITVSDPDAGPDALQVTLAATTGLLTLAGIDGLSFASGDGTSDPTITFSGTLASINTALAGLSYVPTADFNGTATLTITTSDGGHNGSGGSKTDSDSISISVTPVNDAPSFVAGPDQRIDPNSGSVAIPAWATEISAGPSDESGQTLIFVAEADQPNLFAVPPAVAANGTLTFTPSAAVNGITTVTVRLTDNGGTASGGIDVSASTQFTIRLTSDVVGPFLDAALVNDTGADALAASDGVTSDPRIRGQAEDPNGVATLTGSIDDGPATPILINPDGSFLFDPPLARNGTADGRHVATIVAHDGIGNPSRFEVSFTLDTVAPIAPALVLSAASGIVSPGTSSASRVTLQGITDAGLTVKLTENSANALANNQGRFQFLSVPLKLGDNVFSTVVADVAGNVAEASTTIRRVDKTDQVDPVLRWNQAVLDAVRTDASDPTTTSRAMAMVQAAIFDVVNALEGRSGYYVSLTPTADVALEAAISGAAHQVLSYLFPKQHAIFDGVLAASLGQVADGPSEVSGVSFGRQLGDAIIALRSSDGWDKYVEHVVSTDPGSWQPTAPTFAPALDPQWAQLQPWAMTAADQFAPPGPPSLSSQTWSNAYNETKSLGRLDSSVRTAEQTQVARFWADGPGTSTPVGHWNLVAQQAALAAGNSIAENARLFAMLDITLADAAIVAFNAKYATDFWRPITAIQNGDADGNDLTDVDPNWQPLLVTPSFPEYVSGHSTFSGAAATVLTSAFGDHYAFTATSEGLNGVTRSFSSFADAAAEAGRSRIYGGIHYEFSNQDGQSAGRKLADHVLNTFNTANDTVAPLVILNTNSGLTTATNPTITGRVLDNLSGVTSLTAALDSGPAGPVAFNALGQFTYASSLPLIGSADGLHQISFVAVDAAGNTSLPKTISFRLDTTAPTLTIQSPGSGSVLDAGELLAGSLGTSGSPIVSLTYSFTGQPAMPIAFSAQTGQFSEPLDLAKLAPGATTLTVSARDAAGNLQSVQLDVSLAKRVPFTLADFSPLSGARDIGTTQRPQVFFSRSVNPSTLSANNFYATSPSGAKLPANIVPAGDGSFAWLFFSGPLPGGSQITVHLDGSTILAADDGAPLDADGDGTAAGTFAYSFSTVSLTPLIGTSLSGKVLDVGADLKPMTYDDIRAGADQALHTSDDVFLLPLAGVKVYIVGMEDRAVLTDATGNFRFDSVPAGDVKLAIDGRTATNAPTGTFLPEMVMDLMLEAGRSNTVMGTMGPLESRVANRDRQEVYLPRLEKSILQNVNSSTVTNIAVGADAAANLTADQRALLTLSVQPGSLRDQNGNPVAAGQVGISTVPPSLVRDMLPPGLLQHTFDITVQAPGITNFATPAPMTFPNLFGAAPGEKLNFLSFDHTSGRLVIEGSATVSADGLSVSTDPGTGITHPGWHGLTPQGSPTQPKPVVVKDSDGEFGYAIKGVTDYLFTDDGATQTMSFQNTALRQPRDGSYLRAIVTVDPKIANQYLDGLHTQIYNIQAGDQVDIVFGFKPVKTFDRTTDGLIGAKYNVTLWRVTAAGVATQLASPGDSYLYRYIDASDSNSKGGAIEFADTLNDGAGKTKQVRIVDYLGDPSAKPSLGIFNSGNSAFSIATDATRYQITFDPQQSPNLFFAALTLGTPTPFSRLVGPLGKLQAVGYAVDPQVIYLNKNEFVQSITDLVEDRTTIQLAFDYPPTLAGDNAPTFQISLIDLGSNDTTIPLKVGASDLDVEKALLDAFGSVFGPNGIDVSKETSTDKDSRGKVTRVRDFYNITPKNGFHFATAESFLVKGAAVTRGMTWKEIRAIPLRLLSQEQINYLKDPAIVDSMFGDVLKYLQQAYAAFGDAIQFSPLPPPSGANYSLSWNIGTSSRKNGNHIVAQFPANNEAPLKALLKDFMENPESPNQAQAAFRIARVLSTVSHNLSLNHAGTAFIQRFFAADSGLIGNLSEGDVARLMGSTLAHEIGHGMGLQHTAFLTIKNVINQVQQISVAPQATTFNLKYAQSTSADLSRTATALQVQKALLSLPGLPSGTLDVSGSDGGPYAITFKQGFAYPQITGTNVILGETTPAQRNAFYQKRYEVVINGEKGRDDYMRSSVTLEPQSFLPSISQIYLKMSFGTNWSDAEIKVANALLVAQSLVTNGLASITTEPDVGESPEATIEDFLYDGPGLALLGSDGQLAGDQTLDFGASGPADTSVTKTLTLTNFGRTPAIVRSIAVTQGIDRFSVAPFPVTAVLPGESLDVPISFSGAQNVSSDGLLVVDSDVKTLGGIVKLHGSGELANLPSLKVDFYNNLQGQQVGQQTSYPEDALPEITNVGSAPLIISEIRVATGQGSGEYVTSPLTAPLTLAPGESTHIGVQFRPSKVGLRPGTFEVLSNDPRTPLLRIPVVATGVLKHDDLGDLDGASAANNYVAVSDLLSSQNLPVLRARSDDGGNWEFFLPANQTLLVNAYDPVSGLVSTGAARTNAAGVRTEVIMSNYRASVDPDSDGDGLPDDVELAIGTNPKRVDTDGDGRNDFAELDVGQNPLDDRPATLGITAAIPVGDKAHDVRVQPDFRDPSRMLAYVAAGTTGLTIADVSNFARPITIAQLALPGDTNRISIDGARRMLAATGRDGSVSFVDIANPARPLLLKSIPASGGNGVSIQIFDGIGYVLQTNKVFEYDARSGELLDEFALTGLVAQGFARSGNRLYVTAIVDATKQPILTYLDITPTGLVAAGSVQIPGLQGPLGEPVISDGTAWISAGDRVVTVDVGRNVVIKSDVGIPQTSINDVQLNGSGLALAAGAIGQQGGAVGSVLVLQASDPTQTNNLFTRFVLPDIAEKSALSSGFAYVADGAGGLQLVSYLQRDQGSAPPTIQLDPITGDLDPAKPGVQLLEGSTLTISNRITDNVQVGSVELVVNGVVVLTDVSYPYELTTELPKLSAGASQATLQVRATDTGGNVQISAPIVIDLVADLTSPAIVVLDPANNSNQSISKRTISIDFSEALIRASVTAEDFVLRGAAGDVLPISVDIRRGDTRVAILYPPLTEGDYQFTIHAPGITDRAGNPLGTGDIISAFHIGQVTRQPTIRWVNDAGGNWNDVNNWRDVATNQPRVPGTSDDVLMDVPSDALVTFGTGIVTVSSLISNERFQITGGRLNITDTIQVNNSFLLAGSSLSNIATLSGTLLQGTNNDPLTINGESRLVAATIRTDILVNKSATKLRLESGLALAGTLTVSQSNCQILVEGTQTISSGTFVSGGANPAAALVRIVPVGAATLTLGQDVTFQAQVAFSNVGTATDKLTVINRGTLRTLGSTVASFGVFTQTESFTNLGLMTTQARGVISIEDKTFVNGPTGRIIISEPNYINVQQGAFGKSSTTSWTNAGTIELTNTDAQIMPIGGTTNVWTNTGTVIVNKSTVGLGGKFTSDDASHFRNAGRIAINGLMDNIGRTFTFNNDTKSYVLVRSGRILGGTLVMTGLASRLEFAGGLGVLDGVTIEGDIGPGQLVPDDFLERATTFIGGLRVVNGLTLRGTMSIYPTGNTVYFDGAQTVSGGVIQFVGREANGPPANFADIRAHFGGPVVFDPTVTLRAANPFGTAVVSGDIVNRAQVVLDAKASFNFVGFGSTDPAKPAAFVNFSPITILPGQNLYLSGPVDNQAAITVPGGNLAVDARQSFTNGGSIDLTGKGNLGIDLTNSRSVFRTADFGTIVGSDGLVTLTGPLDNSGATLFIKDKSTWTLGGTVVGGTIQVDSTAKMVSTGIFKDIVINGNVQPEFSSGSLVGDVTVNGTFGAWRGLTFGSLSFPNETVRIHAGIFDLGALSTAYLDARTPSITLDPGVELHAANAPARFSTPILNRGVIAADNRGRYGYSGTLDFTGSPITNEGTLKAGDSASLKIANLALPSSGLISVAPGSAVKFVDAFAQAASGKTHVELSGTTSDKLGVVTVGAAATLDGILEAQFVGGYVPVVGSRFEVLTYASHTGQFASVQTIGLAAGLIVTPEYNQTNVTLVITAAAPPPAGQLSILVAALPPAAEDETSDGDTPPKAVTAERKPAALVDWTAEFPAVADTGNVKRPGAANPLFDREELGISEIPQDSHAERDEVFADLHDGFLVFE